MKFQIKTYPQTRARYLYWGQAAVMTSLKNIKNKAFTGSNPWAKISRFDKSQIVYLYTRKSLVACSRSVKNTNDKDSNNGKSQLKIQMNHLIHNI